MRDIEKRFIFLPIVQFCVFVNGGIALLNCLIHKAMLLFHDWNTQTLDKIHINMKKIFLTTFVAFLFTFYACKKDVEFNTIIQVNEQINGGSFSMGNVYTNSLDQAYSIETLTFYLSNIRLVAENGTEELLTEVLLHNYTEADDLKFNIPEGKYTAIKFGFGLDPDLNLTDPTTVAENSPLHTSRNMYWVWATMYRFIKLEGRASADAEATELSDAFLYHIGTNPFYQEVTLTKDITIDNKEETTVSINLNIDEIFENLDVINENSSHTGDSPDLATKVKNSIVGAFE